MRKGFKISGLGIIALIILYLIWIKLPYTINRYSDIKLGNKIIDHIETYKKTNVLPESNDWKTLKNFGFKYHRDFLEPEYQKLNDNNYQLTYIQGFDGPYLLWNSKDKKWKIGNPMLPNEWTKEESKSEKELVFDYKYMGSNDYNPDKKYDLRIDTLVFEFAGNFERDTINIKYNNIDSTIFITTDEVTGLAYELRLGKIIESNMKLKINNYKPVTIIINKENQLFLVEKYDSLLKVRSRYYLPASY